MVTKKLNGKTVERGTKCMCYDAGVVNDNDNVNDNYMTQDETWNYKWQAVVDFINVNHRNPSKYIDEERGLYCNWLRHNRKVYNAGSLKAERLEPFQRLLELMEKYKWVNQYQ